MLTFAQDVLDQIIDLSKQAGHEIMKVYATEFDVTKKDDNSPLTKADMAAHNTIVAGLKHLDIQYPILSEESASISFEQRSSWQTYWLVDPLDGTREFVKRNGEFTVNIALISEHRPILGVIYTPVTEICYFACQSKGAFKQNKGDLPVAIHTKQKQPELTVIVGSRSHQGDSLTHFLQKVGNHEIVSMGSSLKSCLVAEGQADIYPRLGPTSEWDTAAAQCIVEEAGGALVDTQGNTLLYNTKDSLLNPNFLVVGDTSVNWLQFL